MHVSNGDLLHASPWLVFPVGFAPLVLWFQGACPQQPPKPPPSEKERPQNDAQAKPESMPQATASLDTIVISAERGVPLTYPGGRDVVEPETKALYPDGAVETVLRRTPSVLFLPENGNDSRISVGLRGNDPRRSALTTLLLDGIPICEAPYGNTDVDGMPFAFERIWRTDLIRGGASVRYGPNSAGGIINFLTEPVPAGKMLRVGSRIGTDGDYMGTIATGGTWDNFGVLVTGVVKGGDGFRENGEFRDNDGAVKARYAFNDHEALYAYFGRFTEPDAEQPGGLTQAAYDEDPTQSLREGSFFSFAMNRYVLGYENAIDADTRFEAKVWHQDGSRVLYDYRPIVPPFTVTRVQNSDFGSSAIEGSYSWRGEAFGIEHRLFHSMRYLEETNDVFYVRTPIAGGPPITPYELDADFQGRAFSLFTEDLMALTDTLDWGVGFRYESIMMLGESNADGEDLAQTYTELLPETNLTWRFTEQSALYATFQQGFYPPQYETGFDPASVLYAPTSPEHSDAYEVGLRSRGIDGLDATVAVFDTEFDDKIEFINTPDGKVPVNIGHARAYGVELGLGYDLGAATDALEGVSLYGTFTEMRSRIEQGENAGNDTPNAPHNIASFGTLYEHRDTGLWGRIGASYAGKSYKDLANTEAGSADGLVGVQPSFTLWDAAIGWSQHPDRTGFAISIGVTNLFEEEYFRRFATGIYPGAPREAYALISYTLSF